MFKTGMQEATAATVRLAGVEPKVVAWLLQFLYTDMVDDEAWEDDEALCHLLAAAHRYQVTQLVRLCELQIATQLRETVAVERLLMAEHLGLPELRSKVLDFICYSDERLSRLKGLDGFDRLMMLQPQLMVDILIRRFPGSNSSAGERWVRI